MSNYYNKTALFDRSSGEERTVYYYLNKGDGYFQVLDVFWQRGYYKMYSTHKKPTYGFCMNLEPVASLNRDFLLSIPYRYRDNFNLDPFETMRLFLDANEFERLDANEYSSGVLHNRPWKNTVTRI